MTRVMPAATQADVDLCHVLEPPLAGCTAGDGVHIIIPRDFADRIRRGEHVPGCSYAHLEPDGSLVVSDAAYVKAQDPALVKRLPLKHRNHLVDFMKRLAEAAPPPEPRLARKASTGKQRPRRGTKRIRP